LAKAGYPDGFSITLDHFSRAPFPDVAQAIQANLADVGIKAQLLAGEGKQVTTKMRARQFQMTLMTWFPDFLDMHSNAQAFNYNADDSDTSKVKLPAWRCHFHDKELTDLVDKASKELDAKKRMEMYAKMQRDSMERSPFVFVLQNAEIATMHKGVSGISLGLLPDYTRYAGISKA
jgi:peptide/nickel transport system substrate-binding protein